MGEQKVKRSRGKGGTEGKKWGEVERPKCIAGFALSVLPSYREFLTNHQNPAGEGGS